MTLSILIWNVPIVAKTASIEKKKGKMRETLRWGYKKIAVQEYQPWRDQVKGPELCTQTICLLIINQIKIEIFQIYTLLINTLILSGNTVNKLGQLLFLWESSSFIQSEKYLLCFEKQTRYSPGSMVEILFGTIFSFPW